MQRIAGSEEVLPKPSSASTPLPAAAVQEVTKSLKKVGVDLPFALLDSSV